MKNKIIFTGGGTAGHVIPNISLISILKNKNWEMEYIGSKDGIERKLISEIDIKYYEIPTGKLRRYFAWKNFTDPFRVFLGLIKSYFIIRKFKPNVVFSKGGFVSVPVVLAAYLNKIPVIIHESDITPGLANKLSVPFCSKICISFPESKKYLPKDKVTHTGTPIRNEILNGNKESGYKFTNFSLGKPILTIIGGSLGSKKINDSIRSVLFHLTEKYQVIHICGKGNIDESLNKKTDYKQFEYLGDELPDIFSISDLIVSRAGSNSIFELLSLKKPNLLIPLSKKASRGDQILNANSFEKQGYSKVVMEEELTDDILIKSIDDLFIEKDHYIQNMNKFCGKNSNKEILDIIDNLKK